MQDCAYELIDDIGIDVTLTSVTQGTYNPATGTKTNSTSDSTVKAMLLNYRDSEIDGTLILQGDRRIVIAARGAVVPETDDLITANSIEYRLISVRQVSEASNALIYSCQARQE